VFNCGIAGIEDADALLLIGSNPRREAPVLNARIRKRSIAGKFPIGAIGVPADLTYKASFLGDSPSVLQALNDGTHYFAATLKAAKQPMIIVGQGALARPDGAAILAAAWKLAESTGALTAAWHGFNVLHTAAARVGALDLGFTPGPNGRDMLAMLAPGALDVVFLLGADEIPTAEIPAETFVIYQGHHGDRGAARADVILPGAAYTEKNATYVNTEGRVQRTQRALFPPGDAKEDWTILRALSATLGHPLPYDNLDALRAQLEQSNPVFARAGLPRFGATDLTAPAGDPDAITAAPFDYAVPDYYLTNAISRASLTMAECSAIFAAPAAIAAE
jgi:NADH-quinone oxidoreductase subunit G